MSCIVYIECINVELGTKMLFNRYPLLLTDIVFPNALMFNATRRENYLLHVKVDTSFHLSNGRRAKQNPKLLINELKSLKRN